ncbi:MAG TPA: protein translocase subunit SecD [Anaerolineae bacterium]|nr:protein translocase subunit SecD [Anaerolineae bacterium]HQI83703.1 protein translocase subunit SecD [Anaerolineae bacterium]
MERRTIISFVLILLLTAMAIYGVVSQQHPAWLTNLLFWQPEASRNLDFQLGLDLQGGLQVLMVADLPAGQALDSQAMETARRIVEKRVNALGLTEPVVQIQGTERIVVEIPGIENPAQAVDTIRETALLEFVEPPSNVSLEMIYMLQTTQTPISTTYGLTAEQLQAQSALTETMLFKTVMTGADLANAFVTRESQTSQPVVAIEFQSGAADLFSEYTSSHLGKNLCIVLDKLIISCPRIDSAIPNGKATIQGSFTYETANQLAVQLQYGALPIPLKIESYKAIGPSLGAISVEKSVRAGIVGLAVVFLFMLIYYRLNGLAADLALGLYVVLNLLLYKLVPVTLTLPGIAGFLLSVGMAVDANILVFERMKEELRHGRSLLRAAEAGFSRAWTSVRDSNIATLLTCAILFIFGDAFAASLVKGFAITLAVGTIINLFTALVVTRTLIRVAFGSFGNWVQKHSWVLGL